MGLSCLKWEIQRFPGGQTRGKKWEVDSKFKMYVTFILVEERFK